MTESSFHDFLKELQPLDVACIGFIAWQAIMGAIRGFAFQFLRLATWAGGIVLARQFAPRLAGAIDSLDLGCTPASATVIAWFLLVFGTLLAGMLVLRLVRKVIAGWKLGSLDRVLGFAFAVVKAALIVLVAMILAFAVARPLGFDALLARSKAAQWSGAIVAKTAPALPGDVSKQFDEWIAAAKARAVTLDEAEGSTPR